MKINEIFGNTIQGEGIYCGVPTVFIRVTGCVAPFCKFCDSKYSWKEGNEMSIEQIIKEVKKYKTDLVVVTGGEPFAKSNILELINALYCNGKVIHIETSGKVQIPKTLAYVVCSPKQYNGKFVIHESAIKNSNYFKFVVGNTVEMDAVMRFIKCNKIEKHLCCIMPKGDTRAKQIKIMPLIVRLCNKYNMRMSPRLHILVWDKKRGV